MKKDSIIFDLDGTLWDSAESVVVSWNETLKGFEEVKRLLTVEDIKGVMGLQLDEIGDKFFPDVDKKTRECIMEQCAGIECDYVSKHGGVLFESLEGTLEKLSKKYKLFIVSNCQEGYIEAFYNYHKLEKYFADFENPGRTGLSKGENIKLIVERNNLQAPLYVGDTLGDCKAAKLAGIPFVYARYGFGEVVEYDYVIDTIKELVEVMDNIK